MGASALPAPRICEQARLSRDPRFDGLFFTAVTSTRIYCRSVCPVRSPKHEHIRYYATAAAAEADGFRPCLRCRPELAPGDSWSRGDATVARALKLIEDGFLADESLAALALRVGVGERQLRRLFVARLGATPPDVHRTRRLLFAKQLLTETSLPIVEVALESGFRSLRRFNTSFREAYRLEPRELRRRSRRGRTGDEALALHLGFRPPYDFAALLDFLRPRALPGLELVGEHSYARALGPRDTPGWLRVSAWPGDHALRLEAHCRPSTRILEIVTRVRRMFDLDADPESIGAALAEDAGLRPLVEREPGLRLPGGWEGFETAIRAVLERGLGIARARTLATRVIERYGTALETPPAPGLDRLFPAAETLADADLGVVGLDRDLAAAVRAVARALLDGRVDLRPERTLEDFVARWSALPGVDPDTAHAIALQALGHPDAFPVEGLVLPSVARAGAPTSIATRTLVARAERWRPWRAYAVVQLRRRAGTAGS